MIFAIDPGPQKTGWARMDGLDVFESGVTENEQLSVLVPTFGSVCESMAYEMVSCYGMPVGREVFETCVWIGRFIEQFGADKCQPVYRQQVKLHLCGSPRAKDANVRRAILDLYQPTGGGTTPQVGTKKQPGPLFGVSSHVWPAIGVGLTFQFSGMNQQQGGQVAQGAR